ncbi:MAG: universal stress protein [Balneolales bacterium]
MFKKILLGTDLSIAMDNLSDTLSQLRVLGAEEVILAHIVYVANTPGLENSLMNEAKPRLAEGKKKLEDAGFKVRTEIFLGKPAHSLVDLADKHNVDLILVGSHGYGTLTSLTLGGVSEKILNLTKRPVLLSRIKTLEHGKEKIVKNGKLFDQVLFPTDFSDMSELSFGYLKNLVKHTGCAVNLITVRNPEKEETVLKELKKIDLTRMRRMKHDLENQGAEKVEIMHESGKAANEIVDAAKECSLIIMGIQGEGLLKRLLLGSVAQQVARKADVPIIFIPAHCLCGDAG